MVEPGVGGVVQIVEVERGWGMEPNPESSVEPSAGVQSRAEVCGVETVSPEALMPSVVGESSAKMAPSAEGEADAEEFTPTTAMNC